MENENTKVSVTLGYTLNLGNFQSLRIDLGVVDSKRNNEDDDQVGVDEDDDGVIC